MSPCLHLLTSLHLDRVMDGPVSAPLSVSGVGAGRQFLLAHPWEDGEHLPGHIALQAADDFLLGLALADPAGEVVLGRLVVAQPGHHDSVERCVGLAVPTPIQPMPLGLARGGLDRGGPAQHRERRIRAEPIGVVPGGDQQRPGRVGADPKQGHQPRRRRGGEPVQLGVQHRQFGREGLVAAAQGPQAERAAATGVVTGPSSSPAVVWTSRTVDRSRSCSRSSAGAVTTSALSALMAWVRALIAVARATRSERIISTWPSPALGMLPWLAWTARAAASASSGSDLPRRRCAWRSGRLTSTTAWPWARRKRVSPAPKLPVPSIPQASIWPRRLAQPSSSP